MQLDPTEEQRLLRDNFSQLFAVESSPERVRASEPLGFDPVLWKQLAETGALVIRVPEAAGGAGGSLLDAAILAEEAGRKLAAAPLLETIVAARLLASCEQPEAARWLERLGNGEAVVSLALHDFADCPSQWIAGGAVAQAVVGRDGTDLVLLSRRQPCDRPLDQLLDQAFEEVPPNLGSDPIARWDVTSALRLVLANPLSINFELQH